MLLLQILSQAMFCLSNESAKWSHNPLTVSIKRREIWRNVTILVAYSTGLTSWKSIAWKFRMVLFQETLDFHISHLVLWKSRAEILPGVYLVVWLFSLGETVDELMHRSTVKGFPFSLALQSLVNSCPSLRTGKNFNAGKTHPQGRHQSVSQQAEALSSHPCAPPVGVGTHGVFGGQVKWGRTSPIDKSKTGN